MRRFRVMLFSFDYWLKILKALFLFLRREGEYLVVHGKKINITSFIPYIPVASIVMFVSLAYFVSRGAYGGLFVSEFVVWDEAVVVSAIESMEPFTPLIEEKTSVFVASLKQEITKPKLSLSEGGAYIGPQTTSIFTEEEVRDARQQNRKEVVDYTVQSGDTLSSIAEHFNLSVSTLKWANNIENIDEIKPGQVLKIPPTDGVLYTVKSGDTLLAIVNKFSGDLQETLKVNKLDDPSKIFEGQKILIAGGRVSAPSTSPSPAPSYTSPQPAPSYRYVPRGEYPNSFPYGWCTWYVASRRYIPWSGNARSWYYNAQAMGYAVGPEPRPGAIAVLNESWWGHVAIVEANFGSSFLISEMNGTAGWGRISRRVITVNDWRIIGFIY